MSNLTQGIVVVIAIAGVFLYFPTNRMKAPGRWFFQDTWLDTYIPLVPYFVIPYLAYYPYTIGTVILMLTSPHAMEFFICFAIAGWSAALFWYLFPAGILRKHALNPGFLSHMIVWFYENDHENNTIPSSHVFHALICSYYLTLSFPHLALLFAVIGGLISISTVLVKQHHAADILGGILWAGGSIGLAQWLLA